MQNVTHRGEILVVLLEFCLPEPIFLKVHFIEDYFHSQYSSRIVLVTGYKCQVTDSNHLKNINEKLICFFLTGLKMLVLGRGQDNAMRIEKDSASIKNLIQKVKGDIKNGKS